MDYSLHIDPFPNAGNAGKPVDIPSTSASPSVPSHVAGTCVHIREQDSHCEQCRQQIRSMSRSILPHSSYDAIGHHSTDLSPAGTDIHRQRRRASHCPSASDPSMHLLSSSRGKPTTLVPARPSRQSLSSHRLPAAAPQLRGPPEEFAITTNSLQSSRTASTTSPLRQSSNAIQDSYPVFDGNEPFDCGPMETRPV